MIKELNDYTNWAWQEGVLEGQQSCAASPWHYRTDTGDETGQVVESVELPENGFHLWWLPVIKSKAKSPRPCVIAVWWDWGKNYWWTDYDLIWEVLQDDDWLRKHLIAWAEIRG